MTSHAAARRALLAGSLGFWASIAVCLAIAHGTTVEHDGISYFSVRATTLPVIVLGYGAVITGMLGCARRPPDDDLVPATRAAPAVHARRRRRAPGHPVQQGHR